MELKVRFAQTAKFAPLKFLVPFCRRVQHSW